MFRKEGKYDNLTVDTGNQNAEGEEQVLDKFDIFSPSRRGTHGEDSKRHPPAPVDGDGSTPGSENGGGSSMIPSSGK